MRVISSEELNSNPKKYLDLASNEQIIIQRGKSETFILQKQEILDDNADLARAISAKELINRIVPRIEKMTEE